MQSQFNEMHAGCDWSLSVWDCLQFSSIQFPSCHLKEQFKDVRAQKFPRTWGASEQKKSVHKEHFPLGSKKNGKDLVNGLKCLRVQLRLNLQLQAALQREYFHSTFFWEIERFLQSKKFPVIFENFNLPGQFGHGCQWLLPSTVYPQELNVGDVVRI